MSLIFNEDEIGNHIHSFNIKNKSGKSIWRSPRYIGRFRREVHYKMKML